VVEEKIPFSQHSMRCLDAYDKKLEKMFSVSHYQGGEVNEEEDDSLK
jgi:hypothetical protein